MALKRKIKRPLKRARLACLRKFKSFGAAEFTRVLQRVGVSQGDVIMVHSAFDKFETFTGTAQDIIATLQQVVGRGGTLLMPTLSFSGTAVSWAEKGQIFDVRRTPSQTGLLTDLFRRMPGVTRSVHPTHSVAAWGAAAADLVADHHRSATPCGAGTPYARLAERRGKILMMGTGIEVLTYFHTVEEQLESRMPFSPFTQNLYEMKSKDFAGVELQTRNRLFAPAVSRRRNLRPLVAELKAHNAWHEARVGTLDVLLLRASDISAACQRMADRDVYCYDAIA